MHPQDTKAIQKFVHDAVDEGMSFTERLQAITKEVAAIPWGEGRSIVEALETKKVGTCTGKHLVLQACYDELGIEYQPVVCVIEWGKQSIQYPDAIQKILDEGSWGHGHNFVRVKNEHGEFIDVDITYDAALAPYGFRTFPEDWDGIHSTPVAFDPIIKRWDNADMPALKSKLIEALDPATRDRRERFLKALIAWVDELHRIA